MRNLKNIPLLFILSVIVLISCNKADYLDVDAGDRTPLSAKVKFVNARTSAVAVDFWDFTRKVTISSLQRNTSSAYLDTQYGKVQYNLTEGTSGSYKASYVFGGSANFVQETNSASFAGPNGPIAGFSHTLFAVKKRLPSTVNPNNIDSLILVYDDLTPPAAGKAKVRFANFSPDAPQVDLNLAGAQVFTKVGYGTFADQAVIPYTNGKAPATVEGLTWKTLGPFKEITAGANLNFQLINSITQAVIPVSGASLPGISLSEGKLYTIYINGLVAGTPALSVTIVIHN